MADPLVTIIIPCYNAEQWIAETIQSALNQTYSNCETIVIDDGSTDGSREVIAAFRDKIYWESGPNRGGCAARNRGLELAKGEWIQFLDADDVLDRDKIAFQMEAALQNGPDCVISGSWRRFRHEVNEQSFPLESIAMPERPAEWLIQKYSGGGMMAAHAWLTSLDLIRRTGGWDETLTRDQDGEFFDEVVAHAKRIVHCPRSIAYYRTVVFTSVSGRRDRASFESGMAAVRKGTARLLSICESPTAHRACAWSYMRIAIESYPQFPDISAEALRLARLHGGAWAPVSGGRLVKATQKIVGWKAARRCHEYLGLVRRVLCARNPS